MAYTLSQFCKDANAILKSHPQAEALPKVAERLGELLVNPQFVAETFNDDTPVGRRELFHDPELDFYVLAHVQEGGKTGRPHSHGTSWAIYGNAKNLTEMTEYVLPTHANLVGAVFGGQILVWVDFCGAICAQRHMGYLAITTGIDDLSFERAIKVGQVVRLTARVTAAFNTSVEILVEVFGERATTGERWPCVTAFVTCVAVDDEGLPTKVPPLDLADEGERRTAQDALARREHRLAKRRGDR